VDVRAYGGNNVRIEQGESILGISLLKEWCGKHLWAPSCYHGSVGSGWDVVEKYISAHNTYEHNRR
jgi:hypothetical protein